MTPLTAFAGQPVLRMLALLLLLLGAHNAAVYPYQSLIAIERIGLSEPAFAALMALASAVAVAASVGFGMLGDYSGRRRSLALGAAVATVAAMALMLLAPGVGTLIVAHGLLLPVASTLYGQGFTLAALTTADDPARRDAAQPVIRACMSLAFLALLIFFTFAFARGVDVMAVYVAGMAMALGLLLLILRRWPGDTAPPPGKRPSRRAAFAAIARPAVLLRMGLLGAVTSAAAVYMVLVSLVFDATPGRDASDVALYVGMVAGWEVPFMLALPRVMGRMRRDLMIGLGAVIYCGHLVLLPVLAASALIWVVPLLAGLGGAAILTLPIGYFQDLMRGRRLGADRAAKAGQRRLRRAGLCAGHDGGRPAADGGAERGCGAGGRRWALAGGPARDGLRERPAEAAMPPAGVFQEGQGAFGRV